MLSTVTPRRHYVETVKVRLPQQHQDFSFRSGGETRGPRRRCLASFFVFVGGNSQQARTSTLTLKNRPNSERLLMFVEDRRTSAGGGGGVRLALDPTREISTMQGPE